MPEKHQCGQKKCWICGKWVPLEGRRCYIQPETKEKKKPAPEEEEEMPEDGYEVLAFFDTECRQGKREPEDEPVEESMKELLFFDFECRQENGNHEPNLCIVQNEAGKEWIFQGDNTRDEFCEWLFTTEHAGCTVMAHNFQRYHSYFILQYPREQGVKYNVIMRGAKVLSLTVELFDIRFIDSLNFIPMKLVNSRKRSVSKNSTKSYFPHLFNKKENENYVGPIPPAPYYNPNVATAIASACHLVYRTNYLPKDTIGIIPPMGYCPKNNQSVFAHKRLSYTADKNEIYIQHARNGGEKRVGNYLLDGYHEETHTAFERARMSEMLRPRYRESGQR